MRKRRREWGSSGRKWAALIRPLMRCWVGSAPTSWSWSRQNWPETIWRHYTTRPRRGRCLLKNQRFHLNHRKNWLTSSWQRNYRRNSMKNRSNKSQTSPIQNPYPCALSVCNPIQRLRSLHKNWYRWRTVIICSTKNAFNSTCSKKDKPQTFRCSIVHTLSAQRWSANRKWRSIWMQKAAPICRSDVVPRQTVRLCSRHLI